MTIADVLAVFFGVYLTGYASGAVIAIVKNYLDVLSS